MSAEIIRDLTRAKVAFQLRAIETIIRASADTHPKGGDAQQAPAPLSGAVGEAETPKGSQQ